MVDRRLRASCEVLREAGILLGVLYPLENAWPGHIHWLPLSLVEAFSALLVICWYSIRQGVTESHEQRRIDRPGGYVFHRSGDNSCSAS